MLIKRGRWGPGNIRPSEITTPAQYAGRRDFLQSIAATGALAAASSLWLTACEREVAPPPAQPPRPALDLSGVHQSSYRTDEALTDKESVTSYNNFYEFGTDKSDPVRNSKNFNPVPWNVEALGECEKPGSYAFEDLVSPHRLEERIYRLRCVEAWSMVVPWIGIPLGPVLARFQPTSKAKYVAFRTVLRPSEMPGQNRPILDWPYVEGLRIDEAMHPLTFLAVGLFGESLPNQNGAPIRLVVPWKYGFKSIKSIVSIRFTESEPPTSWSKSIPGEYGFYSNVNPEVDHPRWSQAKERRIGEFSKRPTLMFNGYADEVAELYRGMDLRKLY